MKKKPGKVPTSQQKEGLVRYDKLATVNSGMLEIIEVILHSNKIIRRNDKEVE